MRSFPQAMPASGRRGSPRRIPVLWRIAATNAVVITAAVSVLAFSPAQIPRPDTVESALVVLAGLSIVLAVNLFLVGRALRPLRRLTELMGRVDPLRPGERLSVGAADAEVVELTDAFNEMLERLERERKESTGKSLAAQEAERRRIAQELHDEIGQRLTAILLQLKGVAAQAPEPLDKNLQEVMETARGTLEEVRSVAAQLRPVALDDLGLVSALSVLAEQLSEHTGTGIEAKLTPALPPLGEQAELVVYRVAQEALTNAVRHADASRIELSLQRSLHGVRLTVRDDGKGLDGAEPGSGVRGMRERALLIGGRLDIRPGREEGVEVVLEVPRA